jgi:hypothetical protein
MWFIFQQPDELRFRLDADRACARRGAPLRRPLAERAYPPATTRGRAIAPATPTCRGELAAARS